MPKLAEPSGWQLHILRQMLPGAEICQDLQTNRIDLPGLSMAITPQTLAGLERRGWIEKGALKRKTIRFGSYQFWRLTAAGRLVARPEGGER